MYGEGFTSYRKRPRAARSSGNSAAVDVEGRLSSWARVERKARVSACCSMTAGSPCSKSNSGRGCKARGRPAASGASGSGGEPREYHSGTSTCAGLEINRSINLLLQRLCLRTFLWVSCYQVLNVLLKALALELMKQCIKYMSTDKIHQGLKVDSGSKITFSCKACRCMI